MIDPHLDVQYDARASVPDYSHYAALYRERSDQVRRDVAHHTVPYGDGAGEEMDVFPAAVPGGGVLVYVHGGYWRALSKEDSAFVVPQVHAAGATVVVVDYALAPVASLEHIIDQVRRAIVEVHRRAPEWGADASRIVAAGSSAGGHLVGCLLTGSWPQRYGVPEDVVSAGLAVSGLFDLRPLLRTRINEWLGLSEARAAACSPASSIAGGRHPAELVVTCGGLESAEFARQSQDFLELWTLGGSRGRFVPSPGKNHFDVVLDLAEPGSPLLAAALDLLGLVETPLSHDHRTAPGGEPC